MYNEVMAKKSADTIRVLAAEALRPRAGGRGGFQFALVRAFRHRDGGTRVQGDDEPLALLPDETAVRGADEPRVHRR